MSKIEKTLEERSKTHGSFEKNAGVVQHFKNWAKVSPKYNALSDSAAEALDNIFQKIGRILTGDPTHVDSWHDIAGYATLERDILISKQTVAVDPRHSVVSEETMKELHKHGLDPMHIHNPGIWKAPTNAEPLTPYCVNTSTQGKTI